MTDKELIKIGAKCELARRNFFWYCNLKAPEFYKPNRKYLVELCNDFQKFYEGNEEVMIINMPPRHRQIKNGQIGRASCRERV